MRLLGSLGEADLPANADLAHGLLDGLELEAKEGLALLCNNAFSTALAALAFAGAERLLDSLDVAACLDLEAFGANVDAAASRGRRASGRIPGCARRSTGCAACSTGATSGTRVRRGTSRIR